MESLAINVLQSICSGRHLGVIEMHMRWVLWVTSCGMQAPYMWQWGHKKSDFVPLICMWHWSRAKKNGCLINQFCAIDLAKSANYVSSAFSENSWKLCSWGRIMPKIMLAQSIKAYFQSAFTLRTFFHQL